MIDKYSSWPLSIPRSGGSKIALDAEGRIKPTETTIAAWETPEKGEGAPGQYPAPKRVVIRIDGDVTNGLDYNGAQGFPAAVVKVIYNIGTMTREVLVDCVNQSALVVWAQSVYVKTCWDKRRIERMARANGVLPCREQDLSAAISAWHSGDNGVADARWLDAIEADTEDSDHISETSIHPIPVGARGFRFLDALVNGAAVSTPGLTTSIIFSAGEFTAMPNGFVEAVTNGATDTAIIAVPVCAKYLFLTYPSGTIATFDTTAWIEWILAPNTLPVLS